VTPPPAEALFADPPRELDAHPAAREEWMRIVPLLLESRAITHIDRSVLVAVCIEWAKYLDAMTEVRVRGLVITAPSGYPITNPYLAVANRALVHCSRLWPELGLTPSSRTRISTSDGLPPTDAFTEFDHDPPTH
jgi:P27 family predicted phage terminase small subunit